MAREVGVDDPRCQVKIEDARALALKHDLQGVLIVAIRRDGEIDSITYGDHPAQKVAMGEYADLVLDKTITKVPFQTMFGYGTDGTPTRLSSVEERMLIDRGVDPELLKRSTHPDAV